MRDGYSIHIVTNDPEVFDLFLEAAKDRVWEANMVCWDSGDNWMRKGADAPRSALADTENVGMQVVEEPPEGQCIRCEGVIVQQSGHWLLKEMLGRPGSSFCPKGGDHEPWHPLAVKKGQPDPWHEEAPGPG